MYIRKSIRSYKGRTYTNYVLVESLATPKGPRQRTVCSLGDLSPRPRADWLKLARKIEDAVVGQTDLLDPADAEVADIVRRVRQRRESKPNGVAEQTAAPVSGGELIKVDPSRVTTERHREAGPVHVGYQFWQRLELDRILRDCGLSETVRQLSCAMILNRLIAPCSEHAMPDWVRRTALGDILGVDFDGLAEDRLYQVLDKLYPLRAAIEAALVARAQLVQSRQHDLSLRSHLDLFRGTCHQESQGQARPFARSPGRLQTGSGRLGSQPRWLPDHARDFRG